MPSDLCTLFGSHFRFNCPKLVSAQWKRLPIGNESPPARAYHSLIHIGSCYLLFGDFDGKLTYGDIWWLVPEGTKSTFN